MFPKLPTTITHGLFVRSQVGITDTKKRATVLDPTKGGEWGRPWVVRGAAEPVNATVDSTAPLLHPRVNMAHMQTPQW